MDPSTVQNAETTPEPQDDGVSRVQKRINQLTARNTESQNLAATEKARADHLAGQNSELLRQIQNHQPTTPRPAQAPALGAPNDPLRDFLGVPQQVPQEKPDQPAPPQDIEAIIAATVQQAIAPFVQLEQNRAQETQLHTQQTASFDEALQFLPNLANAGSLEQQLFDTVLTSHPELRQLPAAPLLVANMVSGLLSAGGTPQVPQETRKVAASPPTPTAGTFDLSSRLADVAGPGDQAQKNKDLRGALVQKGTAVRHGGDGTGLTNDEMEAYIGVAMERANAK